MHKSMPILVMVVWFCAAFVFAPDSPNAVPVGDVSAPLRTTPSDNRATLIFHGGPIFTMDREGRVVRALATRDDTIAIVGDERSVLRMLGPDTLVVDLRGKALVPGFIDVAGRFERVSLETMSPEQRRALQQQYAMHGYTTLPEPPGKAGNENGAWLPPISVPGEHMDLGSFQRLDSLTRAAAHLTRDAQHTGSLEPGKQADLVVLGKGSLTAGRDTDFEIHQTVKAGRTLFRR